MQTDKFQGVSLAEITISLGIIALLGGLLFSIGFKTNHNDDNTLIATADTIEKIFQRKSIEDGLIPPSLAPDTVVKSSLKYTAENTISRNNILGHQYQLPNKKMQIFSPSQWQQDAQGKDYAVITVLSTQTNHSINTTIYRSGISKNSSTINTEEITTPATTTPGSINSSPLTIIATAAANIINSAAPPVTPPSSNSYKVNTYLIILLNQSYAGSGGGLGIIELLDSNNQPAAYIFLKPNQYALDTHRAFMSNITSAQAFDFNFNNNNAVIIDKNNYTSNSMFKATQDAIGQYLQRTIKPPTGTLAPNTNVSLTPSSAFGMRWDNAPGASGRYQVNYGPTAQDTQIIAY